MPPQRTIGALLADAVELAPPPARELVPLIRDGRYDLAAARATALSPGWWLQRLRSHTRPSATAGAVSVHIAASPPYSRRFSRIFLTVSRAQIGPYCGH